MSPARVLLVVSGGIAAYKAPELVRALTATGKHVQVVMTVAASAFVTELSLATVSGRQVRTSLLDPAAEGSVGHIELADWPDLVLVAPATADLMARAAAGLANDLASTVLLATQAPVLWAPAMNTNMWRHPATRDALAKLVARGGRFVGPDRGELACGWVGEGRMIDPHLIAAEVDRVLALGGTWNGRRVLVSAGPTRAHIDPVRFLTNASSGAMGFAIAEAAAQRGAQVTLVAGPVERATPPGVARIDVNTAQQMLEAMDASLRSAPHDLVAMVAAVSDLTAKRPSADKLPKDQLEALLGADAWTRGIDVLATLTRQHAHGPMFLGFGAQTLPDDVTDAVQVATALRDAGLAKLASKGCDALFVNRVGVAETGFGSATNTGLLLARNAGGEVESVDAGPPMPKAELAAWIIERLHARLPAGGAR